MISVLRLPPALEPGARVGVAALSGPIDRGRLEAGLEGLIRLGYEPVPAANLTSRHRFFAGSDDERLAAFHELAADPSLGAIFFARGGHGVLRLLGSIDWGLLAGRPRFYVGYSDLTPFLDQVVRRLGLVAVHGPMVAVELADGLGETESEALLAVLAHRLPIEIPLPAPWRGPTIEGRLVGGCLSMLVATLGTPFQIDCRDALVFWEDTGEPPYRLDRMATQLRLSTASDGIRGLLVGAFEAPSPGSDWTDRDLSALIPELEREWQLPVACGVPSGHGRPNYALPLGPTARLEEGSGVLIVGLPVAPGAAEPEPT